MQSHPSPRRKRTSWRATPTMRIPTAIVSLIVLSALAAAVLAKSATHKTAPSADLKDSADDYCSRCVDGYAPRYRPIRGADEVRICEGGYYCDCQAGRKIKCKTVVWVHGNFDPDHPDSPCSLTFSCQEWFDKHPVPTPSSPTTSPASSSPPPSSTSPTPASSSLSPSSTPPTPASSSLAPSSTRPTPASSSLSPYSTRSTPASSSLSPYSTRPTPASSSPSPYSTRPTPASSSPSPYSTRPTPASSSLSPYSTRPTPASSSLSPYSTRPTPASSSLAPSSTTSSPSTPVPSTTCLPTQCPFRLSLMLPDPTDCHRYIRCYNGESWNMPCAIGTWFSFSHQACVYLEQSDCAIKN